MRGIRYDYFVGRINELCEERGWSKYKLMQESDIPKSTFYDMFDENAVPQLDQVQKICDGLNITLGEFFADVDDADRELSTDDRYLIDLVKDLDKNDRDRVLAYAQAVRDGRKKN